MLTFDEARHEYRYDGEIIPSVTGILKPLVDYSMIDPDRLRAASELGTMVHHTTELHDLGVLDEDDLDPILQLYLDGWKLFRHEVGFVPDTVEKRMYHPLHRYCGTSDRTGAIRGVKAVVDIKKMMTLGPAIGPQLAAYKEMHNLEGAGIQKRYALGLRPDGTYRLQEFTDPSDLPCFMSLLTVMRSQETIQKWRAKHGK
ncbi:MAG: hypothetical protein WKG03_00075 [Telluria sp.]